MDIFISTNKPGVLKEYGMSFKEKFYLHPVLLLLCVYVYDVTRVLYTLQIKILYTLRAEMLS